jgi:hypothetical protein
MGIISFCQDSPLRHIGKNLKITTIKMALRESVQYTEREEKRVIIMRTRIRWRTEIVTYVVTLRNTGNGPLTGLVVTDDLGGYDFNGTTVYPLMAISLWMVFVLARKLISSV